MVGDITGTVVTIFAGREDVQSLLPPELTFANDDTLPAWLRERDGHPVIAIIGSNEIGRRKRILGRYHTVPLFPNFLETFVAVPYLRPVDGADSETCFHFARVYCQKFWPTEVGRLCVGWPKQQCPMRLSQEGDVQRYEIEQNGRPVCTFLDFPVRSRRAAGTPPCHSASTMTVLRLRPYRIDSVGMGGSLVLASARFFTSR